MMRIKNRGDARAAPSSDVLRIVSTFVGVQWPIAKSEVPSLEESLGWTPESPLFDGALVANTNWPINRPEVDLGCDNGELTKVSFRVTDVVRDDFSWRGDFLSDAFAQLVAALVSLLGRPDKQSKGSEKHAWWDLENRGRVGVSQIETSVFVFIISAEWAEVNRKIGE